MIKRGYRAQESQIRYWVDLAAGLSRSIDDESLAEYTPLLEEALAKLGKDRRVVVFGGKGCGKSALLAGLCGCPVIARAPLAAPYVRWRRLCQDGDSTDSRFLPEDALAGLELVDTQACTDPDVAVAVQGLVAEADVLIAVVDTRTAKDSPVWDILAELPPEALGSCLLAANFTDKLSAEASLNIAKNLQEFSKERLGAALRVCVSNPTSEQSMVSFSARVQEILDSENGVRADIRHLADVGMDLVRKQGRVLNNRAAVARTDVGFLSNIEQEIDNFLARQEQGIPGLVDSYVGMVQKIMPRMQHLLRHVLGYTLTPVTILRLERLAAGTEDKIYDMLCSEILGMQQESDRLFIHSCAGHWRHARPRMKDTLACEIGEFPDAALAEELANLRTGLCRDLYEPFSSLKLRLALSRVFTAPSVWLLVFFWLICLMLFVAGVFGFIGMDETAVLCVALAGVIWLGGSAVHYLLTRRIISDVEAQSGILADGLRSALNEAARRFVVSRVAAYRFLYVKPRQTVAQHETMLAPLQERYKFINMQLNASAQRL